MPVSHTDLPLVVYRRSDAGAVIYLPFELSAMLKEFKLADHYQLVGNMVDILLERRELEVKAPSTVQVTMFESEGKYVVHLINETGERPLRDTIPVHGICVEVQVPSGCEVKNVRAAVEEQKITWQQSDDRVTVMLDRLDVWEMLVVEY